MILLLADGLLPNSAWRQFKVVKRIPVDVAQLFGPAQAAFHRASIVASSAAGNAHLIEPLLHVKRPQITSCQARVAAGKQLQPASIPLVGGRGSVLFTPAEKSVHQPDDRLGCHRFRLRASHELMVLAESFATGSEIVLFPINLDAPQIPQLSVPRLRMLRHQYPSRTVLKQPSGPEGSLSP